jgi:hypothetical protein
MHLQKHIRKPAALSILISRYLGTLSWLPNCLGEDPFPAVFLNLGVQQVEAQLVFMLAVGQVALTINAGVPFGGELVGMAISKTVNPATGDLLLRNRASGFFFKNLVQALRCLFLPFLCIR